MSRFLCVLFFIAAGFSFAQAQTSKAPKFAEYPAKVEKQRIHSINFKKDPTFSDYKTRISRALREGVNFAGRYILTGWGCGTGCTNALIIDARTGKIFTPAELSNVDATYGDEYSEVQLEFRKNSRLLIIHGRPGTDDENAKLPPPGDHYYEWKDGRLRHISSVEKK